MPRLLAIFCALSFTCLIALPASAQVNPELHRGFSKPTLFVSADYVPLYVALQANVEIPVWPSARPRSFFPHRAIRMGGGIWGAWEAGGVLGIAGATFLQGTGNHHLETFVGATLLKDTYYTYDAQLFPAGFIGYRYQTPAKGGLFRAGIGWPKTVSLSLGLSL